jgi:hypothetical protein
MRGWLQGITVGCSFLPGSRWQEPFWGGLTRHVQRERPEPGDLLEGEGLELGQEEAWDKDVHY